MRKSGQHTKRRELLQSLSEIFSLSGGDPQAAGPAMPGSADSIPKPISTPRKKLVIFTEHRDTLSHLERQIGSLLGRSR